MNSHLTAILTCVLCLSLIACTRAPSIDASTPQMLKQSTEKLRAELTPEQADKFDLAITMIVAAHIDPMQTIALAEAGTMPTQSGVFQRIKQVVDGLTYDQILVLGDKSRNEVHRKLDQWQGERDKLRRRYDQYVAGSQTVGLFKPIGAELRTINQAMMLLGGNQVEVEVTFANELDVPVAAADFIVGLAPPGVDGAWVRESVRKTFAEPVPPNGQVTVKTKPIFVSIPDSYPGDVQFEAIIEISRLQTVDGTTTDVPTWDEGSMVSLAKLDTSIEHIRSLVTTVLPDQLETPR